MMELAGTKTEANLVEAFSKESEASSKYTFYASKACEEGYMQISQIFKQTAAHEKEHAKIWYEYLCCGIPDTKTNLKNAAAGENYEWTNQYLRMAKEAYEEGFCEIGDVMEQLAKIEQKHEECFVALLNNIEDGSVFEKKEETVWECLNCGHLHVGKCALLCCPVCHHKQSYFQVYCENY